VVKSWASRGLPAHGQDELFAALSESGNPGPRQHLIDGHARGIFPSRSGAGLERPSCPKNAWAMDCAT